MIVNESDGSVSLRPLYENSGRYNILKSTKSATQRITVSGRSGNLMHREYYMNLPSGYKLTAAPATETTVFTVLTGNTSVRVGGWIDLRYYVVSYGEIVQVSGNLGSCIVLADETAGAVYDGKGRVIWKRGIKDTTASIRNLTPYYADDNRTELQAILQMIFSYKGSAVKAEDCDTNAKPLLSWITDAIPGTGADLSGATLAQALQFVSDGRPVIARYRDTWVLITGYESNRIFAVSPKQRKTLSLSLTEARATLGKGGVFYSYVD